MAIRILTVSIVRISSLFARTCLGVVLGEPNFGVLLAATPMRSIEDMDEDKARGAGAGTRTRNWRERHRMAVVTVLMWALPPQNLEYAV